MPPETGPVRVAIADDSAVIRLGVRALLQTHEDVEVVGEATDGRQAVALVRQTRPDVLLLDVRMPVCDGLSVVEPLAALTRVVMLTYSEEPGTIEAAIRSGACGYLVHGSFHGPDLHRAILGARGGGSVLSPSAAAALIAQVRTESVAQRPTPARHLLSAREAEVMDCIAQGCSNREIGRRLYVTEKTAKNHITNIYTKLNAHSRAHAVAIWFGTSTSEQ